MPSGNLRISSDVIIEKVGRDVVVLGGKGREVVVLTAQQADVVDQVAQGIPLDDGMSPEIKALIDAGVFTGKSLPTRRGFLGATAAGAGVGLLSLSMPVAAAASSPLVLTGVWGNDGGTGRFAARYTELLTGDPGVLTVPGGTAPFNRLRNNYGSPDVDYILWQQVSSTPPDNTAIQGTFTWAGVLFTVNFTYDLPLIQDIVD